MNVRSRGPVLPVASLLALSLLIVSASAGAQTQRAAPLPVQMVDGHPAVANRIIVKPRDVEGFRAEATTRLRTLGVADSRVVREVGGTGAFVVESAGAFTPELMRSLSGDQSFEYVEPDFLYHEDRVPNDPYWQRLWGMRKIRAPQAWNTVTASGAVVVGVIDSGVAFNHRDLRANMWSAPAGFSVTVGGRTISCPAGSAGYDAVNGDCTPSASTSHGTHVAGTIGAVGNNARGVAGIAWQTQIMGLRFIRSDGFGSSTDAAECIEFARQARRKYGAAADVRILNNSWGGGGRSQTLLNQIRLAAGDGMLFVAAAGNEKNNNDARPHYPSSYTEVNTVLGVAATTSTDALARFTSWGSNWGPTSVHVAAPGASIYSTIPTGYSYKSGTSMATPHVAGAAALVAYRCNLAGVALHRALTSSVDRLPSLRGKIITEGRINVERALNQCP